MMHLFSPIRKNWWSTARVCAFIPLLGPIWSERPLQEVDVAVALPTVVNEAAIRFQANGVQQVPVSFRSELLQDLAATRHPAAVPALVAAATEGETDKVRLDALSQLHRLPVAPEDLQPIIHTYLEHASANFRYWAGRLAAHTKLATKDLATLVALAAEDPDPRVRRAVRDALPQHAGTYDARPAPWPFHADDDLPLQVAGWPAVAAARNASTRAAEAREQLQQHPSPAIRQAIWTSWIEHQPDLARTWWTAAASDPHRVVRAAAAREVIALGHTNDEVIAWLMSTARADPAPYVRQTALEALAELPPDTAWPVVLSGLDDAVLFARQAAESTAVRLGHDLPDAAADLLAQAVAVPPDSPARLHSVRALARLCDAGQAPADAAVLFQDALLELLATDTEPDGLVAILDVLHTLTIPEARPAVVRLAQHREPAVRAGAARLLGRIGDESVYDALAALLRDEAATVRPDAIEAAGRIGDARYNAILLDILRTRDYELVPDRSAASWAAARMDEIDDDVMQRLRELTTRPLMVIEGEPIFDQEEVLVSSFLAIAEVARHRPEQAEHLERITAVYARNIELAERRDWTTMSPPHLVLLLGDSYLMQDMPRQAAAWLQDETDIPALPLPERQREMRYRSVSAE